MVRLQVHSQLACWSLEDSRLEKSWSDDPISEKLSPSTIDFVSMLPQLMRIIK